MRALIVAFIVCVLAVSAQGNYGGGSGTAQDPYQIATAADLIALGETPEDYGKHFILTADIDLDPNFPGGKVFDRAVIAPDTDSVTSGFQGTAFTGVFDGNGHTILHLTIEGESWLGLFGHLSSGAEVRDLCALDVNITGGGNIIGGLAGDNDYAYMALCSASGTVHGENSVGGLVGRNSGTVTHCGSASVVTGDRATGGLVGTNYGGTVTLSCSPGAVHGGDHVGGLVGQNSGAVSHSYSTGAASGGSYVGGLVGSNVWRGRVTQCYSTGVVSGTARYVGGLVGSGGDVLHSVWDIDTSGLSGSSGGVGLTTAEMMDPYMLGLNGLADDPNWILDEGRDYPRLAWENTVGQVIGQPDIDWLDGGGTPEDPYRIDAAEQLVFLGRASALCDRCFVLRADIDLDPNLMRERVFPQAVIPRFVGVFDGNDHTISHLTITGTSSLGLFGRLASGAEIKDMGLVDVSIVGSGSGIGSLVGYNAGGRIAVSYSSGSVGGTGQTVGGLVGENYGDVTASYSTGSVNGMSLVGGLAGINGGYVSQCYNTSSVSGDQFVGGLVGSNIGQQSRAPRPGAISNCYSRGAVDGEEFVGGLVGGNGWSTGEEGIVADSFWDIQTSGQAESDGGTGKTTAEMQTAKTFLDAGWDFVGETANGTEDIWWILEGQDYPRLWWELYVDE